MRKSKNRKCLSESGNKIYIPDEFKDLALIQFPEISNKILTLLKRHKVLSLIDLQNVEFELLEKIVCSSKSPFPELRRFIVALQQSEEDEVILIEGNFNDIQTDINEIPENVTCLQNLSSNYFLEDSKITIITERLSVYIDKLIDDLEEISEPIFLDNTNRVNSDEPLPTRATVYQYEVPFCFIGWNSGKIKFWLAQNRIFIPDSVANLKIEQFTLSKQLLHFSWKYNISTLKDLRKVSDPLLKDILGSNKGPFPELRYFITIIQYTDALVTLEELVSFINNFVERLNKKEKAIFLGRFGGTADGTALTKREVLQTYEFNKLPSRSTGAIIRELKKKLGRIGNAVLKNLTEECNKLVCPLTSQLLIHYLKDKYELFQHPPVFYIRLFNKIYPQLPILPEVENQSTNFQESTKKIEQGIKSFLEKCPLPVSLPEVFNQTTIHYSDTERLESDFFEAIQSVRFNLMTTDNPKELFIELHRLNY